MATTESNGNDDRQGCCTLWLQKMVSLCSLGSSESGQNDDDDNDHVSTDQTEEYDGYYYDHIEVHRLDKARALQLAARTSRLLVDFLFLISEQGGVVKVLGQFAAALESESKSREQENLEVVTKMLALLETAEKELRNTMTDQSRELKAVLTPDHGDESLVFDGLVDKFCQQIPRLEAFLMRQCAAESLMSTECALEEMIGILDQCEAGLDAIEREIACEYAKTTTNPDDHESDYDQILKRDMVLKAKEIWCVVE